MKAADVRAMTLDQIDDEVLKLKKEQFNLRFQRATGQLENTSRVRVIRRDIARLKTIAAQKRAGMPSAGAESGSQAQGRQAEGREAKSDKPKPRSRSPRRAEGRRKKTAAKSKE